jgi:hypothetical protein
MLLEVVGRAAACDEFDTQIRQPAREFGEPRLVEGRE